MKKYILITFFILLLLSCTENAQDLIITENNDNYFEKLEEKYGKSNGYIDLKNGVIELDNMVVLEDLKLFTGNSLLVHIGYSTWLENSIEILTKLKELDIDTISLNIRNDIKDISNDIVVDSIILTKEEAILFSEFKTKNKSLTVTMGKDGIGKIICNDEIAKILGVKKEECDIIQINK